MSGGGKIFGIGISRTGSMTLTRALEILGHRTLFVTGYEEFERCIDDFDAFTHTPLAPIFAELDRRFPGSRFILLGRERKAWLRSCEKQFAAAAGAETPGQLEIRRRVYGVEDFDREVFTSAYVRHVQRVREHFRGRPEALLEIDVCAGEGWEKLGPFLGNEPPDVPFPSENSARDTFLRPSEIFKRFAVRHLYAVQLMHFAKSVLRR